MSVTAVPLQPIAKGSVSRLWLGVGIVALVAAGYAWVGTRGVVPSPSSFLTANAKETGVVTTESGLQYKVIREGKGPSPKGDDVALVSYRGTLINGTVFDQNDQAAMRVSDVVPGFSEALKLMKRGGEYQIFLPPELAYGSDVPEGAPIPPNALLKFDVKLLDFKTRDEIMKMQMEMQKLQAGGAIPPQAPVGQ